MNELKFVLTEQKDDTTQLASVLLIKILKKNKNSKLFM